MPDPGPISSAAQVTGASQSTGGAFGINGPDPIGNFGSMFSAAQANAMARENTVSAEQYDTQMADTVYQRGVEDMKAAGLNPILAAGSPDPSPTISTPQTFAAQQQSMSANTSHSASQSASDLPSAQVALTNAQALNTTMNAAHTAQAVTTDQPETDIYKAHPKLAGWLDFVFKRGLTVPSAAAGVSSVMAP